MGHQRVECKKRVDCVDIGVSEGAEHADEEECEQEQGAVDLDAKHDLL